MAELKNLVGHIFKKKKISRRNENNLKKKKNRIYLSLISHRLEVNLIRFFFFNLKFSSDFSCRKPRIFFIVNEF